MSLLTVRTNFIELSGRADLVDDYDGADYSDNGADKFIVAGQDLLDRMHTGHKENRRVQRPLGSAAVFTPFRFALSILEAWVTGGDGVTVDTNAKLRLKKKSWRELRELYPNEFNDVDTGRPLYYCTDMLSLTPEHDQLANVATYIANVQGGDSNDTYDLYFTNDIHGYTDYSFDKRGVVTMPPSDGNYLLTVVGKFKSNTLALDADVSYWTEEHPLLLAWAACHQLEVSYRNTTGARDWLESIQTELLTIDTADAFEESADVTQMMG